MSIFLPAFWRPVGSAALLGYVIAACVPIGVQAQAAESGVALDVRPPIAKGIDAFPLPRGATPALDRVRATLTRLDKAALKAAADCEEDAKQTPGMTGDWSRTVSVTMAGPRLLSYFVGEDASCGGPHPNESPYAVVFDLRSGRQLDWLTVLPRSLAAKQASDLAVDGMTVAGANSGELRALLLSKAATGELPDGDCTPPADDIDGYFVFYPDGTHHTLKVMQTGLAHAIQGCGLERDLPLTTLRSQGFPSWFIDALAHAAPVPAAIPKISE